MIFVTIGSTQNDFSRLLREVDRLASEGQLKDVIVQSGCSSYSPRHCHALPFLPKQQLRALLQTAEFVICHGGAATLNECLSLKKKVIAVPRQAALKEAPDDHQFEICELLEKTNRILLARDISELQRKVLRVMEWMPSFRQSTSSEQVAATILDFMQAHGPETQDKTACDRPGGQEQAGLKVISSSREAYRYALITAARNEGEFIERTIYSVCKQTVLPIKWIIVSDGSTDNTDVLIRKHAETHRWIEWLRMESSEARHFGRKAACFNAGFMRLRSVEFEIVGNLDADVSFEADYMAYLLDKFASFPKLGVAGTRYVEGGFTSAAHRGADLRHVSGQCQMFRRSCLEQIGGYLQIPEGGIDTIAVTAAQMNGWDTRTFIGKSFTHHRPMGSAANGALVASLKNGKRDCLVGNHPIWEVVRALNRMMRWPYLLGGGCLLLGYLWTLASRPKRHVSGRFVAFRRQQQMHRLTALWRGSVKADVNP